MDGESVRPDMVSAEAYSAWQCLTVRQQAILRRRARGETCHSIALRFGISKQAVSLCEGTALARLATLAGRPLTFRAQDVAQSCRADYSDRDAPDTIGAPTARRKRPRWQLCQDALDDATERWLHARHGARERIAEEAERLERQLFAA